MSEQRHDQTHLIKSALDIQPRKKEDIMQYKAVVTWMKRGSFAPATKVNYEKDFRCFLVWKHENGGKFASMTPDDLVEYQKRARRSSEEEAEFEIIDELIHPYIKSIEDGLRDGTLRTKISTIKSFFKWNRASLPDWPITWRAGVPKTVGNLSTRDTREICSNSNSVYLTVFLCMYMGVMDLALFNHWNTDLGYKSIEDDVKKGRDIIIIRSPGRKKFKNKLPFYTLIGGDAVDALYKYLENERKRTIDRFFGGDPEKATAIFYNQKGTPVTGKGVREYWHRKLVQLGLIVLIKDENGKGTSGNRYGKNPHELRDTMRSKATGICAEERIPTTIFEFFMGHQIDKNEYDKYCKDEVTVKRQYRKAIPYLNIMTSNKALGLYDEEEVEKESEVQRQKIKKLEAERETGIMGLNEDTKKGLEEFLAVLAYPKAREKILSALRELGEEKDG